jgi:hypothetical protein
MDSPEESVMQPKVWTEGGLWWFQESPCHAPVVCRDEDDAMERGEKAFLYRRYDRFGFGGAEVAHA